MEILESTNLQEDFINFMEKLIHDTTALYFRSKKTYPVTESVLCANAYYARILFDVVFCTVPSIDQIKDVLIEEQDTESLLSSACFLYEAWLAKGEEVACNEYCDFLNGLIDEQAMMRGSEEWLLLPDFHSKRNVILEKLYELKEKSSQENIR